MKRYESAATAACVCSSLIKTFLFYSVQHAADRRDSNNASAFEGYASHIGRGGEEYTNIGNVRYIGVHI